MFSASVSSIVYILIYKSQRNGNEFSLKMSRKQVRYTFVCKDGGGSGTRVKLGKWGLGHTHVKMFKLLEKQSKGRSTFEERGMEEAESKADEEEK